MTEQARADAAGTSVRLLHHDDPHETIRRTAAIFLRIAESQEGELGRAAVEVARKFQFVPGMREGRDLLVDKTTHRHAQRLVFEPIKWSRQISSRGVGATISFRARMPRTFTGNLRQQAIVKIDDEVIACAERYLKMNRLARRSVDVALYRLNLARRRRSAALYDATGAYTKAELLHQRALTIREKAFNPEHPDTALSLNNLAALYEALGAHAKAEPLY
jgi:hypothetical protein